MPINETLFRLNVATHAGKYSVGSATEAFLMFLGCSFLGYFLSPSFEGIFSLSPLWTAAVCTGFLFVAYTLLNVQAYTQQLSATQQKLLRHPSWNGAAKRVFTDALDDVDGQFKKLRVKHLCEAARAHLFEVRLDLRVEQALCEARTKRGQNNLFSSNEYAR